MDKRYIEALPSGTILQNNYEIKEVLGRGGFGITYLAHDIAFNQKVAIKEYFPSAFAVRDHATQAVHIQNPDDDTFQKHRERFLKEARTLNELSHPNIVKVRYFMALNNTAYMIMDYEEGEVLTTWLNKFPDRKPPQDVIYKFLGQVLDALRAIHSVGVAHRDLKPDNIYMRKDDSPVILDFGAARNIGGGSGQTSAPIHTPGYSPYEQYSKALDQQGPWTDIYALGAVLYRFLTGKTPPEAPTRVEASLSEGNEPDPCLKLADMDIPGYDKTFLAAIDWALEIQYRNRPQSIDQWYAAFGERAQEKTILDTEPVSFPGQQDFPQEWGRNTTGAEAGETLDSNSEPDSRSQSKIKQSTSSNLILSVTAAVIVSCVFMGALYFWFTRTIEDQLGDTSHNAYRLGALSNELKKVTDYIGGEDKTDIASFELTNDSEIFIKLEGAPYDMNLRILDENKQSYPIYNAKDGKYAELASGSYELHLTSKSRFADQYTLSMKGEEIDISRRPQNSLEGALDLSVLGDALSAPVRYRGRLYPGQREHYFRINLFSPAKISVTTSIRGGIGQVNLTDDAGVTLKDKLLRVEEAQIISETLDAGTYYIVINSNDENIFEYAINVRGDDNVEYIKKKPIGPPDFKAVYTPKSNSWTAKAIARLDTDMTRDEALLAAQTLARLRLTEKALSNPKNMPESAARLSNIVKLLSHHNNGVPFDEKWETNWGEKTLSVQLKAKFAKAPGKDYITASIKKNIVKALEPIEFNIQAKRNMYLSVFAWQANGKVLRLYPRKDKRYFILSQGQKISLPYKDELAIQSTPISGRTSSDEALIVVGCYEQFDYTTLVPDAWKNQEKSVTTSVFFQRVATSCRKGLSIQVLNYTVYSDK